MTDTLIEVTQADRDLATKWASDTYLINAQICQFDIQEGRADNCSIVKSFAAHRHQSAAAMQKRIEKLEAALCKIKSYTTEHGGAAKTLKLIAALEGKEHGT